MSEERVIDGVLHVLEGKTFRALTAEELTARLLEARRALDAKPAPWNDPQPWSPHPLFKRWEPYVGDVIPNPYEITAAGDMVFPRAGGTQ